MGSILFGMLDLPDEVAAIPAAPGGAGEQLQTHKAAKPAAVAVANGGGSGSGGAGGEEAEGDPFSRIEIKVGRITKASPSSGRVE